MKPVIGISTWYAYKLNKVINGAAKKYIEAIEKAGGIPILIPIVNDKKVLDDYLQLIDGLILTGGADVSPMYYDETPINGINKVSQERDEQELALIRKAHDMDMPILGICRGLQALNVALGGSLYQDIQLQIPDSLCHIPNTSSEGDVHHMIQIEKETLLYKIFGTEELNVNSYHHQSVKEPSSKLKVVATSADGVIEAVEARDKPFIVGCQWHPERMVETDLKMLKLFEIFVDHCSVE